jgi:nitrite reductase/ring-hydroxylating ferredoxin subunit
LQLRSADTRPLGQYLGDARLRVKTYPVSVQGDDVVVEYAGD